MPYNTLTMSKLVSFIVAIVTYALKYFVGRSEVGLEAIEAADKAGQQNLPAQASVPIGGTVINYNAPITNHYDNCSVAVVDPSQGVKFAPRVVAGTDTDPNRKSA